MRIPAPSVKAVAFDAVGTLLFPDPPALEVYLTTAKKYGAVNLDANQLAQRFGEAFLREEKRDEANDWKTDEQRERQRWSRIVVSCLREIPRPEECFEELFSYFASPEAWGVHPHARAILDALAGRGIELAIASNFDSRLRHVVVGFSELRRVDHVVISSLVGWRKPSPHFFNHLRETLGCAASEILMVGDDLANDHEGAMTAGMQSLLYDPHRGPPHPRRRLLGPLPAVRLSFRGPPHPRRRLLEPLLRSAAHQRHPHLVNRIEDLAEILVRLG